MSSLSFTATLLLFAGSVLVITIFGIRLAKEAEKIASLSGIGQAITGGLFLGAITSLPGLVTSITAAWQGYAQMAVSNSLGGIAAQTSFLALGDLACRKTNLEYAAASLANIMQAGLLLVLLATPLIAMSLPSLHWWGIHPATPVMVAIYCYGMKLVTRSKNTPMWTPREERGVQKDQARASVESPPGDLKRSGIRFFLLGLTVGAAGWVVGQSGIEIIKKTGASETLVGGLFTALASSMPELVTCIAAVKNRAYTLAVGGIIGGNAFDVLFLSAADLCYRGGSIFHAISEQQIFLISSCILMTAILLLGLVSREKQGIANIGFESFAILLIYGGVLAALIAG